jgi:DNA repair exonuclease SbcCD ATPase subunit
VITFKKIRWRNFLSTGNVFTEIQLNEHANTLIIGSNGAGKSTILDALTFVLFGKAFRKINKPTLVNSVNEKGCVVEIEFETNGKQYKITRGIKPTIFEIYCDGTMINQDSASRDYQDHLEKMILKMNYKTFTQIVILGSASFVPFMQLSTADRRAVIEDLLDIQIFSVMNTIVKQRYSENKSAVESNRLSLVGKEEKKVYIEKTIRNLKQNNEEKKSDWMAQRMAGMEVIAKLKETVEAQEKERDDLIEKASSQNALKEKHRKLISLQSKIETKASHHKREKVFFEKHDTCPTCTQSISDEFKNDMINKIDVSINDYAEGLSNLSNQIDTCISEINKIDDILQKANNLRNDITSNKTKINSLLAKMNDLEDQINNIDNTDKLMQDNLIEYDVVKAEIEKLQEEKQSLIEDRLLIETAINLLKDGGIKTKIIKQYLPIINKHINKYLAQMGFFVNFEINEQFEETIKSRYRDVFSYHNFSEGEKTRIDLALLFTWRSIAKMRNSVNTNLLILDEIFDGSLDGNGTDEFLKIMWNMLADTNTFVISHKTDQLFDKFQKVYKFQKIKNFSSLQT